MKAFLLVILMIGFTGISKAQWIPYPILFNTYYGGGAFALNETGNHNAAFGNFALYSNTTGNYNTAVGAWALYNANSTSNVAVGRRAAYKTTTGSSNTVVGQTAMQNNTTGSANVAIGNEAMNNNVTGYWNTAVGMSAGPAFGHDNLYNATAIGYYALNTANAQVRIGNEFVTDIGGYVSWSTLSDGRFKKEIREDVAGLEFINNLRPISYTLDKDALSRTLGIPDSIKTFLQAGRVPTRRQAGFVAQEVEALIKKKGYSLDIVYAPQNERDHYGIRYAEFVVPLVRAVQELSQKLDEQDDEIAELREQLKTDRINQNDSDSKSRQGMSAVLGENFPNPFSAQTEIEVFLPEHVKIAILNFYTPDGKRLKTVPLSGRGNLTLNISSEELSSGMCIYSLTADGVVIDSRRLVIKK
jgi:hypothetical protein